MDDEDLFNALRLTGGGVHDLGKGQITDDSEMAMCLTWGLIFSNRALDSDAPKCLNIDTVTRFYAEWVKSGPFDIDSTVNFALNEVVLGPESPRARQVKEISLKINESNMSNGALVRVPPLAIWSTTLESDEDVKRAIICDVELTHPNKTAQDMVFVYAMSMRFLLNNFEMKDRAYRAYELAL